ncbi:MAG: hypothetical protein F6K41_09415 [Symploca sp. SIO3E6]|nr:hypothetical protein [Caldora sp. SIO3E6]
MQTSPSKQNIVLLLLIILNIIVSLGHYIHNMMFLPQYYEPDWITPSLIDTLWFVMTPFSCIGYLLYLRGSLKLGYLLIYIYCFLSLLVLGHYVMTPIGMLSLTINLVILAEAIAAVILALYTFWLQKSSAIIESTMSDN